MIAACDRSLGTTTATTPISQAQKPNESALNNHSEPRNKNALIRLALLFTGLLLLFYINRQSTWLSNIDPQTVREAVQQWGELGLAIYALAFIVGLLLYVPGTVFIVVAGLIYGPFWGSVIALLVANLAIFISFNLIRWLGGAATAEDIHPWLSKRLNAISRHPVRTIAFLRVFLWTAPALNYLLALTTVEQRHHLLGSFLGSAIPIITIVLASDYLLMR